jgi:opacity protein-like surface antigen
MLNKKHFSAIILFAISMTSTVASAQVYVDVAAGSGQWSKSNCGAIVKCTNGTAFKLTGGYTLDKNFSLEASAFTRGNEMAYRDYRDNRPVYVTYAKGRMNGVSLAGVFNYEFNERFSGFTKLGIASLRYKGHWDGITNSLGEASYEHSSTHLLLGAGVKYKLNDNVSLTLALDQFRLKSNLHRPAARVFTVGAQYSF